MTYCLIEVVLLDNAIDVPIWIRPSVLINHDLSASIGGTHRAGKLSMGWLNCSFLISGNGDSPGSASRRSRAG
jgi:hypothetical protein